VYCFLVYTSTFMSLHHPNVFECMLDHRCNLFKNCMQYESSSIHNTFVLFWVLLFRKKLFIHKLKNKVFLNNGTQHTTNKYCTCYSNSYIFCESQWCPKDATFPKCSCRNLPKGLYKKKLQNHDRRASNTRFSPKTFLPFHHW
jgi:hypothetical protein